VTEPRPSRDDRTARLLARAGTTAAAFVVFTCGWLAMKSQDWRGMVLWSLLAMVASLVASSFARRAR
jgi:hypothetical protein